MSEVDFQLWEFKEAPADLQRLIPEACSGGWLALISSADPAHFACLFASWWQSAGLPLAQCDAGEGQIVLAGPHPNGRRRSRVRQSSST